MGLGSRSVSVPAGTRSVRPGAEPKAGPAATDPRRDVPSVDAILRLPAGRKASSRLGRPIVRSALRDTLDAVRADAERGTPVPTAEEILATALTIAARDAYGLQEVINATGVVLHTGLGRAPMSRVAARAAARAAEGYADLEVDRDTGSRGRRTARAERLLSALTDGDDALAVNNGAGALLLLLAAMTQARGRKDVLVSRGELIEIGGEFRLPDIMAASGARLVEVGTTNRTRPADYERAITTKTALILKVHPSNYRVVGFTHSASLPSLRRVADKTGVPLAFDLGSGLLQRFGDVPTDEPAVTEALAEGADAVLFSGDKLLGGPQAGLIVGTREVIERLRRHPIARAVRLDKMSIAALEATLRLYATGRRTELPLWRLLDASQVSLAERAKALVSVFRPQKAVARPSEGAVGGGSLPGYALPSAELVIPSKEPEALAARLRVGRPAVFCRVADDAVAFDLRTVPPQDDDRLIRAIRYALAAG
jgi:L-seryl-tRNA(Ser) seleniumtransferase